MRKRVERAIVVAVGRAVSGGPRPGAMRVLSLGMGEMSAGTSDVWHRHAAAWELMVQADGRGIEHSGGSPFEIRPGDAMLYRPGMRHGTANTGTRPIRQYVLHFEAAGVPLLEANRNFKLRKGEPVCRLGSEGLSWFEQLFNQLWWELTLSERGVETAQDALLRLMLVGLERRLCAPGIALAARRRPDVLRFVRYVRESLGQSSPLHVAAAQMGTNYDSLRHRFKQEMGMSPKRFLMTLRIQEAKHLLLTTSLSVKEIAGRLGYGDPHHFSAAFTVEVGRSPHRWRHQPSTGFHVLEA